MILQIQCVFTHKAAAEDLEQSINLPLVQGRIESDLSKFKLGAGSEWGPGLGGIPRSWTSMLRVIFTIFFEFSGLRR